MGEGGGFSLEEEEEEECALPDTHAQSLAQIEDLKRGSGTTIVKLDDAESPSQENVMTYTTIIKSKHVRHATYVSKECLDSMDYEPIDQLEPVKEGQIKVQPTLMEPSSIELDNSENQSPLKQGSDVENVESNVPLCSDTETSPGISYASALVEGTAKPTEPVKEEPKKPYHYRDPSNYPVEEEAEHESKDVIKVSEDGFQEFISKKERRRRKTQSQSETQDTIALIDEVQNEEQQRVNLQKTTQDSDTEPKDTEDAAIINEKVEELLEDKKNEKVKETLEYKDPNIVSKTENSQQNLPERKKKKKKAKVKPED